MFFISKHALGISYGSNRTRLISSLCYNNDIPVDCYFTTYGIITPRSAYHSEQYNCMICDRDPSGQISLLVMQYRKRYGSNHPRNQGSWGQHVTNCCIVRFFSSVGFVGWVYSYLTGPGNNTYKRNEIMERHNYECIITRHTHAKIDYHTVKPVYNDHLWNKVYYLWFIQQCVLMMTEGTHLVVLTMSAFWSSSRWPLGT